MISSESLKGKIKYISEKNNLNTLEVLQIYFFERFLDRLEKSEYRPYFIIKGGLLISSLIGVAKPPNSTNIKTKPIFIQ